MRLRIVTTATLITFFLAACGGSTTPATPLPTTLAQVATATATVAATATLTEPTATVTVAPPPATMTPARGQCPPSVLQAFNSTQITCDTTQRNQVCYSSNRISYEPRPGQSPRFEAPGDIAPLSQFETFSLDSHPQDDEWGILLMRVQANLPDTLPGQNVSLLMFGGGTLGQTDTGAFTFSSGIGEMRCDDAPADGLLIQSPQGPLAVTLNVNGVDISLGSTAYLEAQPGAAMTLNVVTGRALVTAAGETQAVIAGMYTQVKLDADGLAAGAPSVPQAYPAAVVEHLPTNALALPITIAPPAQPLTGTATGTLLAIDGQGNQVPTLLLARQQNATEWQAVSTTGLLALPAGTYEVSVGEQTPARSVVTVSANQQTELPVISGTVRVLAADGNLSELLLVVYDLNDVYITSSIGGEIVLPVGTYRLDIASTPTLTQSITVTADEITTINLATEGTLMMVNADGSPSEVLFSVTDKAENFITSATGSTDIKPGNYVVTVYTDPSFTQNITVAPDQITRLQLPTTGTVQVLDASDHPTSVLLSAGNADGQTVTSSTGAMILSSGTYTLTIFTQPQSQQEITVGADETVTISIADNGMIQLVDLDGAPLEILVSATTLAGKSVASSSDGTLVALPGTYTITVFTQPQIVQEVTVTSDTTTTLKVPAPGTIQAVDVRQQPVVRDFIVSTLDQVYVTGSVNGQASVQPGRYIVTIDSENLRVVVSSHKLTPVVVP